MFDDPDHGASRANQCLQGEDMLPWFRGKETIVRLAPPPGTRKGHHYIRVERAVRSGNSHIAPGTRKGHPNILMRCSGAPCGYQVSGLLNPGLALLQAHFRQCIPAEQVHPTCYKSVHSWNSALDEVHHMPQRLLSAYLLMAQMAATA